jgi:hypothetical protein
MLKKKKNCSLIFDLQLGLQMFKKRNMNYCFLPFIQQILIIFSLHSLIAEHLFSNQNSDQSCILSVVKPTSFYWENDLPYYLAEKNSRKCGLMYEIESIFDGNKKMVDAISYGDSYEWVFFSIFLFSKFLRFIY